MTAPPAVKNSPIIRPARISTRPWPYGWFSSAGIAATVRPTSTNPEAKTSAADSRPSATTAVEWPVGLGAKGNEGVTAAFKTTPYTIGYIERAYATQNKLPMAELKNKAGKFVAPTTAAMSAAADGVEMPPELYVSLVNSSSEAAYPITGYTYMLVYADAKDATKGEAIAKYLWWGLHDGQKFCEALDYAPLPAKVVTMVEARLKELTAGGKKLL
jgi:phosphate transport system substrate-binding protein